MKGWIGAEGGEGWEREREEGGGGNGGGESITEVSPVLVMKTNN